jgi:hypothetical protein
MFLHMNSSIQNYRFPAKLRAAAEQVLSGLFPHNPAPSRQALHWCLTRQKAGQLSKESPRSSASSVVKPLGLLNR